MVLSMLRDLPPHSRWAAWFHDPARGPEHRERWGLDRTPEEREGEPETNWMADKRTWTTDRMLAALVINRLQDLGRWLPHWEEGKGPKFETVGPAEWRGEEPHKQPEEQKPVDKLTAAMAVFGFSGPSFGGGGESIGGPSDASMEDAMAVFGYQDGGFS